MWAGLLLDGDRSKTFAEWLKGEFEKRGWTVRQAALYTKVNKTSLGQYLKGEQNPSITNIKKLADHFRVDWRELEEMVVSARPVEKMALGVGEDEEVQFVDLDRVPLEDREKLRKAILAMVKSFEEK